MPAGNRMAIAFIETNIQPKMMKNSHHDSPQPHLIEGNDHHSDKFASKTSNRVKGKKGLC